MTDVKADVLPKVSAELQTLSDKILPRLVISEHGVLSETVGDKTAFIENAPKKVIEAIKEVQDYESLFASASLHAFGPIAVKHIKDHPENKRVYGVLQTGETQIALNYTAPSGKKADGTPKDPSVTVAYRRKEHADHTAVRQGIYAKTLEIFD